MSKLKYTVDNKEKGFGSYNDKTNVIKVNKKRHKKKGELLDTLVHETLHSKHKKMKEKSIRTKTAKMIAKMSSEEKRKYYSKLKMKSLNYKGGALKRKFKMGAGKVTAGDFIKQANTSKANFKAGVQGLI